MVLGLVFLFGVAVEMGARRLVQAMTDAVLNRVPVIGGIYNTSKQLVSMLDRQDPADLQGMSVVYCIFGGDKGVGFLALLVSPQAYSVGGRECKIVIVPTAPVPFGGGLLLVPSECILDRGHDGRRPDEHLRIDGCDRSAVYEAGDGAAAIGFAETRPPVLIGEEG